MITGPRTVRHLLFYSGVVVTARCLVAAGGFASAVLIASLFGAGYESDAYFTARLVPIVFSMTLGTAFNLAFLPVYTRTFSEEGQDAAARLARGFRDLTFWVSVCFALLYILCAEWIVVVLAPGFTGEAQQLTVKLTRIMAFAILFLNLYAVVDSLLNAEHRYVLSSLAAICLPLGTLTGILVLAGLCGVGMPGVAVGVLAGATLQFALVIPCMRGEFRPRFASVDLRSLPLKETVTQFGALILVIGVWQINVVVNRMIASLVGEGAVSAFGFAFVFIGLAPVIIVMPVYKVLYPELLRLVAARDKEKLRRLFLTNFFVVAFVTLPLIMVFLCLSRPIIQLAFQYGHFDDAAVAQTADVLMFMSLGLWPMVTCILINYYFCATGRSSLLVWVGVMLVAANTAMAYTLMRMMGVAGIALANSLTAFVGLAAMAALLSRDLGGLGAAVLLRPVGKLTAAAVSAGVLLHYSAVGLASFGDLDTVFLKIAAYGGVAAIGVGSYLGINLLLRNEQLRELAAVLRSTLRSQQPAPCSEFGPISESHL